MDERSVLLGAISGFKFSGISAACSAVGTSCRRAFSEASVTLLGFKAEDWLFRSTLLRFLC